MPDRIYEETDWLASILLLVVGAGFTVMAAVMRQWPMLIPTAVLALLALSLYCRTTLTLGELSVRFGFLGIPALRLTRLEVLSAQVYGRKWDGVNFQVRPIRDVAAQRGGERGVLIRSVRGDFWIQSRREEQFVQALADRWQLPTGSDIP
jgi:hypothetical protein